MRIRRLTLKHALGIQWGLGLEEISLDFQDSGPGVIVLEGDNGRGKSTLLENCIPWPCLLSRPGSLYEHFYGLGERRLEIELNGDIYSFRLIIDAVHKKTEGFIEKRRAGGELETLTHGRMREYEETVTGLFGSLDVFRRSVFAAQKGERFIDLKRSGRKEMLSNILGLAHYAGYETFCKEQRAQIQEQLRMNQARCEALRPQTDMGDLPQRLESAQAQRARFEKQARKLTLALKAVNTDLLEQSVALRESESASVSLRQEQNRLTRARHDLETLETQTVQAQTAGQKRLSYVQKSQVEYEEIAAHLDSLDDRADKLRRAAQAFRERSQIEAGLKLAQQSRSTSALRLETLKGRLAAFNASTPCPNERCLQCGTRRLDCPLYQAAQAMAPSLRDVESAGDDLNNLTTRIAELQEQLSGLPKGDVLAESNLAALEPDLHKAHEAAVLLPELRAQETEIHLALEKLNGDYQRQKTILEQGIGELGTSISALTEQTQLMDDLRRTVNDLQARSSKLDLEIADNQARLNRINVTIEGIRGDISRVTRAQTETATLENEERRLAVDAEEWSILAQACGKNGIPALKMEHSCAAVEDIANDLLARAFGQEWRLSLEIQEPSADGSRMLDVLNIIVHRGQGDTMIENLSGGEEVWVSRALELAIALLQVRDLKQPLETIFLDESDGALSETNALKFFAVLQAALEYGHLYQIFLITHRCVIQAAAQKRLHFSENSVQFL